jgi:hypothetical protein
MPPPDCFLQNAPDAPHSPEAIMSLVRVVAVAALSLLGGCYAYDPYYHPYPHHALPPKFDQAWTATLGAFVDQGVEIQTQDKANGVVTGRRGGVNINAKLVTQADGRVRVEINAGGNLSEDPGLPDRVSRSYDARMGRG